MQVTKLAPDFTVSAVMPSGEIINDFNFYEAIEGKYAVLFFYPLDFTFVCPTEMIALDKRMQAFNEKDTVVISVSIDSEFSHKHWRDTPIEKGGIGSVNYIMAADIKHDICNAYNALHPAEGVALRKSIIIDPRKQIRVSMTNDLPVGRNVDELVRLVDALQFVDKHGQVCPAGWSEGQAAMQPTETGVASYLTEHAEQL